MADSGTVVPRPDPTVLTTEQLTRGLDNLQRLLEARMDGMDRATALVNQGMMRVPSDVDVKINALQALHTEKFDSVQRQFEERDVRAKASENAANVAVNAALQAQKEAAGAQNASNALSISKSETATVKQIDGIGLLITSNTTATNDKISALSSRMDRGDGQNSGKGTYQSSLIAVVGLVVAVIAGIFAVLNHPGVNPTPQLIVQPSAASK